MAAKLQPLSTSTYLEQAPVQASWLTRLQVGGEKDFFLENFSLLLSSGMDTLSALNALKLEAKSKVMVKIIGQIQTEIAGGSSLSRALESSGIFNANVLSLIRIGEESGKLADNLQVVASQLDKERVFRGRVTSAMTYPVFVLVMTLVIGIGISWLVLPRLATVFSSLNIKLPLVTQLLIGLGVFLSKHGAIAVPAFAALLSLFVYFIFFNPKTRFIGQEFLLRFPGVDELVSQIQLARFGFILGSLLGAGLSVTNAFDSLVEVTEIRSYRKFYQWLSNRIGEGNSFQKSFSLGHKIQRFLPPSVQQMIVAAEQSGSLSNTLLKVGSRNEEKTELTTKNLSTVLEPVLLVVIWFGVAGVALAIILPIYSLIGGFTQATQSEAPAISSPSPTSAVPSPTIAPSSTPTVVESQLQVVETGVGYLNVREQPTVSAAIIGRANPGDIYLFTAHQGEWYAINFSGQEGWVNQTYIEELP